MRSAQLVVIAALLALSACGDSSTVTSSKPSSAPAATSSPAATVTTTTRPHLDCATIIPAADLSALGLPTTGQATGANGCKWDSGKETILSADVAGEANQAGLWEGTQAGLRAVGKVSPESFGDEAYSTGSLPGLFMLAVKVHGHVFLFAFAAFGSASATKANLLQAASDFIAKV